MKHHIENQLWDRIPAIGSTGFARKTTRDVIEEMLAEGLIQSPKQAWRTLEKWCAKNPPWYEYGVCLDLGWKLPEGRGYWKIPVPLVCPVCCSTEKDCCGY